MTAGSTQAGSPPAPLKGAPSAVLSVAPGVHCEPKPWERTLMLICFASHVPSLPFPVNFLLVPALPHPRRICSAPWLLSALWRGGVTCWSPRCPAFSGSLWGRISESVWWSREYVTGVVMSGRSRPRPASHTPVDFLSLGNVHAGKKGKNSFLFSFAL